MILVAAVDFDGTLVEDLFPEIGEPKEDVINFVKSLKRGGWKLVLWTCRCATPLENAINHCRDKLGIEFDAINANVPELKELYGNAPRKVSASIYIDDRSINPNELNVRGLMERAVEVVDNDAKKRTKG